MITNSTNNKQEGSIDLTKEDQGGKPGNESSKTKKKVDWTSSIPRVVRCNSVSEGIFKKRKRPDRSYVEDEDPYNRIEYPEFFVLDEAMERSLQLAEELHPNTQKGIKEIASKIVRNVDVYKRVSVKSWLQSHRYAPIEKVAIDIECQTIRVATAEIATQMDPWVCENEVLKSLEGVDDYKKFAQLAENDWEDTLFTNTEVVVGNPISTPDASVKVVIVEPEDPDMNASIQRINRDKYPELSEIKCDFEVMEQLTRLTPQKEKVSRRKIVKIAHDGTPRDI
ncbi:unnamed protein product [Psylliodes chrysocephalus]|uniref:Uncharacterized protein n=1 Tax=Psylliodes chrysocephalus TaxID=3402493 RepID=A0A9P0CVU2_9CUCU|nr:unnamed protein product [Psylliodes chrysocephala]